MGLYQRERLKEYEYRLQNARYGFFGGDWLTTILLFEALDNDYTLVGDPGGDRGGGDWAAATSAEGTSNPPRPGDVASFQDFSWSAISSCRSADLLTA